MNNKVKIAPSILSADFSNLASEVQDVERAGAEIIHVDVMDGHFVPNLTIGPVVVKWVRKRTALPLDVHLMITDPIRYVEEFRSAGSDWITVHYEACEDIDATLDAIRKSGAKVGISIKPNTPVDEAFLATVRTVDLVLIMSVEPGFGGQSFMPEVLPKIKAIRAVFDGIISIDGGINKETAPLACEAGVDWMVAGSAVFGKKDRVEAIRELRG